MISEDFLLDRIMQPTPLNAHVVPVSFPVTSFGDPNTARVATISINPSVNEFCGPGTKHPVLAAEKKRFVDRETLGLAADATPTREQAKQILQSNHDYFNNNPYWWFNALENWILKPIGASYFDGSATHLDLVQWATAPVWSRIHDVSTQEALISNDIVFLTELIRQADVDLLLINGVKVFEALSAHADLHVEHTETWKRAGFNSTTAWAGHFAGTPFIAWSKFLQGQITDAQRQEISDWVVTFS
jgi:hypothetical protein